MYFKKNWQTIDNPVSRLILAADKQLREKSPDLLTADIDECIRNLVVFWIGRTGVI